MAWWQRLLRKEPEVVVPTVDAVAADFPGWAHQGTDGNERTWTGSGSAMLNLNVEAFLDVPAASNVAELRRFFRQMAEGRNGGLVEVKTFDGWASRGIYKQPLGTGFLYTGMLVMPMDRATLVWTCVDGERGTTGIREATVAAGLFQEGRLTLMRTSDLGLRIPTTSITEALVGLIRGFFDTCRMARNSTSSFPATLCRWSGNH